MTTEERFEKIEAGIRDLIVVSRTVLSSIEQLGGSVGQLSGSVEQLSGSMGIMRVSMDDLREAQKLTDERFSALFNALLQAQLETEQKVSRLAEIVDKLMRSRGPNGPSAA